MSHSNDNTKPSFDKVIQDITAYVYDYEVNSRNAQRWAALALLDSLGCAIESVPACMPFIGPIIKDSIVPNGFPLPGTAYVLDPLKAAFDLGACIRYLDHSDAFPGAEWGHPSDNIGAILPLADWLSRQGDNSITLRVLFDAITKAYEIQGVFQMKNAFNKVGLDHVILVKVAATAVLSKLVGLTREQANDAVSQAFADGHPLRIYRQSPNTSPRKGWAGGDACMRAVHLVLMTKSGQPGFPTVLTEPTWGFYDVSFKSRPFVLPIPFGSRIVENHFVKLVAAEGHAIAAVEAALILSKTLAGRLDAVRHIRIRTTEAAMTIVDKTGPLHNAADRDHCMRYIIAVVLLKGDWISAEDYADTSRWAGDLRVAALREKMSMEEDKQMTADYHDLRARNCASGLTVTMNDGSVLDEVVVEKPQGHPWRPDTFERAKEKFVQLAAPALDDPAKVWEDTLHDDMMDMKVRDWVDKFRVPTTKV